MISDRYYYSLLSLNEKASYKKIYNELINLKKVIVLDYVHSSKELEKIVFYLNMDNPHLFYVNFEKYFFQITNKAQISFSFYYDNDNILKLQERLLSELKNICSKIKAIDEYKKVLEMHDLFVSNVLYDYKAINGQNNDTFKNNTILGILLFKTAVCEGVAKAAKYILNILDIKCIVVTGKDKKTGVPHAWNIIKLNGKSYHLDITWDIDNLNSIVSHAYFNLSDSEISLDHVYDDIYPECNSTKYNYFCYQRLIAKSVRDVNMLLLNVKSKSIEIKLDFVFFSVDEILNKINLSNYKYYYNKEHKILTIHIL